MSVLNRLSRIWRNIVHREHVDDDLNAELNAYLDLAADQYSAQGIGRLRPCGPRSWQEVWSRSKRRSAMCGPVR